MIYCFNIIVCFKSAKDRGINCWGVIFFYNTILLLKEYNGYFSLPTGKVESGETYRIASLREVIEVRIISGGS